MDRRDIIKGILSTLGVGLFARPARATEDPVKRYGAECPTPVERAGYQRSPNFHDVYRPFKGASQELTKNVFLFQNLQKELGEIVPHWQGPAPEDGAPGEGDCVGQAGSLGVDILAATDIHMLGQREKWEAKVSVEMSYASSRVEIGKNQLNGRAGSHGEWMARAYKEVGVLHRKVYSDGTNTLDLTGYHPGRSRKYRDKGVPDWLEAIAREHPVKEVVNVRSGQEALDAVCAGMPVLMCSSYAFEDVRDAEGFSKPFLDGDMTFRRRRNRRGWLNVPFVAGRPQWWHAMLLASAILEGRKGGGILNSHGRWNSGPQPDGLPDGGFNVELPYLDLMVKDWFDCWALGSYQGHEALKMRHRLYRV